MLLGGTSISQHVRHQRHLPVLLWRHVRLHVGHQSSEHWASAQRVTLRPQYQHLCLGRFHEVRYLRFSFDLCVEPLGDTDK